MARAHPRGALADPWIHFAHTSLVLPHARHTRPVSAESSQHLWTSHHARTILGRYRTMGMGRYYPADSLGKLLSV
jgi:hypothetical protein